MDKELQQKHDAVAAIRQRLDNLDWLDVNSVAEEVKQRKLMAKTLDEIAKLEG